MPTSNVITYEQKVLFGEVLTARKEELRITWARFQELAGIPSAETRRQLMTAELTTIPTEGTLRKACLAVGWTPNSWQLIVNGEPPVAAGEEDIPPGLAEEAEQKRMVDLEGKVDDLMAKMDQIAGALNHLVNLDSVVRASELRDRMQKD